MPTTKPKLKKPVAPATTTLDALRLEAAMAFSVLPRPDFKYGLNVFFAPSAIASPETVGDGATPVAVIAPADVEVTTLSAALADPRYAALVRERLAAAGGDRVDAWLTASLAEGTFIRVPAGLKATQPVRLDLRFAGDRRADLTVVLAEAGSAVTIVEHLASEAYVPSAPKRGRKSTRGVLPERIRASRTEIIAQAGAQVTHATVQDFGADVTAYDRKGARVEAGASVTWLDCAFGGGYVRSRLAVDLAEPGARTDVSGLVFATDAQKVDQRHDVRHLASRTDSTVSARVAVGGTAKAVYRSLVRVAPGTTGCDGAQGEDTLLLAPRAEVDAMPDLEIGTGDVRARHSASAGRLDPDKLFFLESRGLARPQAARLLIEGFFAPVVDALRESGLAEQVDCLVAAKLDKAVA